MRVRSTRTVIATLTAILLVPLAAAAPSPAATPDLVGRYAGFALRDGGGSVPVELVVTGQSGTHLDASLAIGSSDAIALSGNLATDGILTMTGRSNTVLLHGRLTSGPSGAHPPVVEARYQMSDSGGPALGGTLAVVRHRAAPGGPGLTAVWDGSATPADAPGLPMAMDIPGDADGTVGGTLTLAGEVFEMAGQAEATNDLALVGVSDQHVLVATGRYVPGKDRVTPAAITGALQLFAGESGAMSPPRAAMSAPFHLGGRPHPPTFAVDPELAPHREALEPHADGLPRPVARFADGKGGDVEFVADEVLLRTDDPNELAQFLLRWGGTVVTTSEAGAGFGREALHLIRIDPSRADASRLPEDLQALDVRARGSHRVSSEAGLGVLAAAAAEVRDGHAVGVNWLLEGASHLVDRVAMEAPNGPIPVGETQYNPNAFSWWQLSDDDDGWPGIGTAEAWRLLDIAHRTTKVPIAVIDGGFAMNTDFPAGATGADGVPNGLMCSGNPCPWHGTFVAQVAAAQVDNGTGTAGTGGLVADLRMYNMEDGSLASGIEGVYRAVDEGAKIINISIGAVMPAVGSLFDQPWDDATEDARNAGVLVFASAGNNGIDVDAEDCGVVCWEEQWVAPCEDIGTICIGGTAARGGGDPRSRHMSSNFGYEWCADKHCDVELWAPFNVILGSSPANPDDDVAISGSGTSYSSPYVAGVAALVWAANPSLTADDVEWILHHTAIEGSDDRVGDIVDAEAAVRHALPAHNIPTVVIDEPVDRAWFYYGGFNDVTFTASGHDVDGGCCTYEWKSSTDGPMGAKQSFSYAFLTPGARQITVTAKDATGKSDFTYITVHAINATPNPTIISPQSDDTIYAGATYSLSGKVSDANELVPPCSYLEWSSDNLSDSKAFGGSFPVKGCEASVTFNTLGQRTITLTATDVHGASASQTVTIDVTSYADGSPPLVTIVSPTDGSAHDRKVDMTLDGASLEDGDAATYRWLLVNGMSGGPEVIAETLDAVWRPSDHLPFNCGGYEDVALRLEGTDKDGTTSDEVVVDIWDSPC